MTIAEARNFYKQDEKKYDIENNKDLLKWLKDSIDSGYHYFTDIEDLQQLVNNIANWYEIKYPERELEFYDGIRYFDFQNVLPLSKYMNIEQLMYRLTNDELFLINCNYRSSGGYLYMYDEKGRKVSKNKVGIKIYRKDNNSYYYKLPSFFISAEETTGKVNINDLENYVNVDSIKLDELLSLFKNKYSDALDFKELEECVYDHNCDIELRNKVLQLVALKLLYSSNTIPERGYIRATRFIDEFNDKLNLNLNKEEIDEIIKRDYKESELVENKLIKEKQKRKIKLFNRKKN